MLKRILGSKKILVIFLVVILTAAGGSLWVYSAIKPLINGHSNQPTVPSFAPSNITYAVPILLLNDQSVSTPAPFQQMIIVNSANYGRYAASNLQNVEFFTSSGAVIPSWLESGNSNSSTKTIYWLKLANGIAAKSNITIYMGFAKPETVFFGSQLVGEAPTLSPIYGQYDNGANVFDVYADFGRSSMPQDWSLSGSAVFVPTTGIQTVNGTYRQMGAVSYNKNITHEMVIDASTFYSGSGDNQNIGFYSSGKPNGTGGPPGTGNITSLAGGLTRNGYSATFDSRYGTSVLYQDGNVSLISNYAYPSAYSYSYQQIAISHSFVDWKYVSKSSEYYGGDYGKLNEVYNYQAGASNALGGHNAEINNTFGGLYFSSTTGNGASTQYIYWLRVRALPPNEMMPAVGFNGVIEKPTINLGVSVNSYSATVSGSAEAAPGNFITSYSLNWGDGQTSTGNIPQTHWYSDNGTYTITLSVADSSGLTNTASTTATVGPSIYTTPKPSLIPLSQGTPAWAFNGAFAEYKASYSGSGTSISATMKCTISNVNLESQTCDVSLSYSGLGAYVSAINQTASFAQPPFFIASPTVLTALNSGTVPSSMPGGQISKDVSVSVQAGTFLTYKITASGASEWVDTKSGLIVKMSGSIPGNTVLGSGQSAQMELSSTNIPSSGGSGILGASNLLVYLIIAALVAVAGVGGFFFYRARARKQTMAMQKMLATTQQTQISSSDSIDKLPRIKAMLDKGLITQQEYDEQKKRILENI